MFLAVYIVLPLSLICFCVTFSEDLVLCPTLKSGVGQDLFTLPFLQSPSWMSIFLEVCSFQFINSTTTFNCGLYHLQPYYHRAEPMRPLILQKSQPKRSKITHYLITHHSFPKCLLQILFFGFIFGSGISSATLTAPS